MASPTDVVLRKITLTSFPAAFILLLIHGLVSQRPFPALGILPLAASTVLSLFILRRDVVAALGSPVQALSGSNVFFADVFLAVLDLIFLVISWATVTEPWDRSQVVLGTYGTVFMMVDFAIHTYVALPQIGHLLVRRTCDCPHCRSVAKAGHFSSTVSEYTPLSEGDTEPEVVERDLEEGVPGGH